MTIADSVPTQQRIVRFSRVLWAIGILAITAIVTSTTFTYMLGDAMRVNTYAWMQTEPRVAAETDASMYAGSGAMLVPLPESLVSRSPLVVTADEEVDYLRFYVTGPSPAAEPGAAHATGFVDAYRRTTVLMMAPDSLLWTAGQGNWTLTFDQLDPIRVDGSYSGSGSQFLMYEGPAASATATSDGDGTFNIEVFSDEGYEWVVNDSDSVQTRFSWDPNPRIVMWVRTEHSSTPWTIDFDTPAVSK